jgi:hypothetical protein
MLLLLLQRLLPLLWRLLCCCIATLAEPLQHCIRELHQPL